MKVNVKYMRGINLTVEMSDLVTTGDAELVKSWMKDTKDLLPDYVENMVAKAERDLEIGLTDIYQIEATYYNNYEMPVIMIVGRGYDRRPGSDIYSLFVEAFTSEAEGTVENRYTKN